jgi:hypothetical protein
MYAASRRPASLSAIRRWTARRSNRPRRLKLSSESRSPLTNLITHPAPKWRTESGFRSVYDVSGQVQAFSKVTLRHPWQLFDPSGFSVIQERLHP